MTEGGTKRGRSDIVRQTCADLTEHTMIVEEIFYPAAPTAIKDMDVMHAATVEHAGAQQSIDFTAVLASRKAARGCAAAALPLTQRRARRRLRRPSPTVPPWICLSS